MAVSVYRTGDNRTLRDITVTMNLRPGECAAVIERLTARWGSPTRPRTVSVTLAERLAELIYVGFKPLLRASRLVSDAISNTPDVYVTEWVDTACDVRAVLAETVDRQDRFGGRLPVVVSVESLRPVAAPAATPEDGAVASELLAGKVEGRWRRPAAREAATEEGQSRMIRNSTKSATMPRAAPGASWCGEFLAPQKAAQDAACMRLSLATEGAHRRFPARKNASALRPGGHARQA